MKQLNKGQMRVSKRLTYFVALVVAVGMLSWVVVFPRDTNTLLVVLWNLIAARGIYKALKTFRRVRKERIATRADGDPALVLIANGNVRRSLFLSIKLTAFLLVGMGIMFSLNNATVSRFLIVLILLLMSGGAELDDDEIGRFDEIAVHHQKMHHPLPAEVME